MMVLPVNNTPVTEFSINFTEKNADLFRHDFSSIEKYIFKKSAIR